jgi:uncharacterized protein YkwD
LQIFVLNIKYIILILILIFNNKIININPLMSLNVNFEELAKNVHKEHNRIRTDPTSYIELLETNINYFKDDVLYRPNETPIQTNEGVKAFEEAIEFLKNQDPVGSLKSDKGLSHACEDHVKDIGPKGLISHDSSDGKNVSDRIEKYSEWDGACGENIDFGSKVAQDVILSLLVDDGLERRPHRKNLFNPDYNYIGVAAGEHRDYDTVIVIDYVGGVRDLGQPYYDYNNFKYDFKQEGNKKKSENKPKTAFQLEDTDAPDGTVSVKIVKTSKLYNGRYIKITKKFYTLEDGSQHIVEVEDV